MLIVDSNNRVVEVKNCVQPKMGGRGRTWDIAGRAVLEGLPIIFYCDFTWGKRFYFSFRDKWYSGNVYDVEILKREKNLKILRKGGK